MNDSKKLKELFKSVENEVIDLANGFDDAFIRPNEKIHGIPPMRSDREAGSVLYSLLTSERIKDIMRIFEGREDADAIKEKLENEANCFMFQVLADFCMDARNDGLHDISEAAYDNASILMEMSARDMKGALDVANDIVDNMSLETEEAWREYFEQAVSEQGIVQFEMAVAKNLNDEPVFFSHLNFECPYYRTDNEIAANCGKFAARDALDLVICATQLDKENVALDCYRKICEEFPDLREMNAPSFIPPEQSCAM